MLPTGSLMCHLSSSVVSTSVGIWGMYAYVPGAGVIASGLAAVTLPPTAVRVRLLAKEAIEDIAARIDLERSII